MGVTIKFNGEKFLRQYKRAVEQGLTVVATKFRDECKMVVNKPNTGRSVKRTRATRRGKKGSSYTIYPNPSRPGEPPRKITGLGQRSITFKKIAWHHFRVGVQKVGFYMAIHEFKNRSWLLRTYRKRAQSLKALFVRYVQSALKRGA